jgi:hypothetical protein
VAKYIPLSLASVEYLEQSHNFKALVEITRIVQETGWVRSTLTTGQTEIKQSWKPCENWKNRVFQTLMKWALKKK